MKLCDNKSRQSTCLAISIAREHSTNEYQTATLTPDDCLALGIHLINHAKKHGVTIPLVPV